MTRVILEQIWHICPVPNSNTEIILHKIAPMFSLALNLNLTGTFQLSQMAARIMKEHGGGKIVNMASIGGFRGDFPENANSIAYTASKGAVMTVTKDLAVKWAPYGITVNATCPGWFPTSLNERHLKEMAPKWRLASPSAGMGERRTSKG